MGLELAKIVREVEQTFGIRLAESETSTIARVSQLYDVVAKALSERPQASQLESCLCDKLCRSLESIRELSGQQIHPTTLLRETIPIRARRQTWRRLEKLLPAHLPPLRRPRIVGWLIALGAAVLAWLCTFGPANPKWVATAPAAAMICLFFIGPLTAFFGVVGFHLTTPLAIVWGREIQTVGDLARAVVSANHNEFAKAQKQWSDDEIWNVLRQIVVDVLDVDAGRVTREARFADDLIAT